jgi:drug/metabolite transporter (DMT)-like permease
MASENQQETKHVLGILLIVASTAFFALAGILTKAISSDAWTIACWRGFVGSLIIAAYVVWRGNERITLSLGWRGWMLVAVGSVAALAFITSFKFTYVANVAIIYATVPFMAAGIEWLTHGERTRLQTILTAVVSLAGVAIMVGGSIGHGNLFGDAIAVLMTFLCAVYMVMVRLWRETPVVWAAAISAFLLFLTGWLFTDPLDVSARDMALMAAFGATFACAVILWTEGARLLPAAEAGLLGSTEVPLAILFAWLILSEFPPIASIAGGLVVLCAVAFHASLDLTRARAPQPI